MPDTRSAPAALEPAVASVMVRRNGQLADASDRVAVERALEIRVNGHPFSVVMRTPGADEALAAGFLCGEGLLRQWADVDRVEAVDADVVNVVVSRGRADAAAAALTRTRPVMVTASCGVCGRPEIDSLSRGLAPLPAGWRIDAAVLTGLTDTLAAAQPAFAQTGGLHAAALFDADGHLVDSAEDIGRHNAVDKLIGRALLQKRLPLAQTALLVSGRTSFEIVQKAWVAGVPVLASVSAPSDLAVSTAVSAGITLAGFLRGNRFNVYAHRDRIAGL
jgi:FdhD protein